MREWGWHLALSVGLVWGGALCTAAAQTREPVGPIAVLPLPKSVEPGAGSFRFRPGLTAALDGAQSERMRTAMLRALKRLEDRTGVELPRTVGAAGGASVVVTVASNETGPQGVEEDESYRLVVTTQTVHITAHTEVGAMHGLETFIQMVHADGSSYTVPAVTVDDAPRFAWRGLMIDCARHFEPLDVLKRNIDAMAVVKLNVFHWHLTDDQGFRIESKIYPKLTQLGSDGLFYTQDDARELVRYARDRGIRVVPEFEMPGHSAAWLVAYPELASGTLPGGIRREFGISDSALDPTRDETYTFIDSFLREMTAVFPDRYIHVGGDETPAPDWKSNPRISVFKQAHGLQDNDALQAYFNQKILGSLVKLNRRMMGWDEILNPALPKDVLVQSWRGELSLAKGAQQGYEGVLSAPYYLDAMKPADQMYLADPVPADTTLTAAQQQLILGGEVTMWAEHLDARTIDSRVWPRTAAIAERFWSAQNVRDVDDMYRRLLPVSVQLEALGVRHLANQDAMLRSLADNEDIDPLRAVAEAFEPVSFGERYQQQKTNQLTPLTNFVDAVRPDPPQKHALAMAAAAVVADPKGATPAGLASRQEMEAFFRRVSVRLPEALALAQVHPRLQPMRGRLETLQTLSALGTDALSYLQSGAPAPDGWKAHATTALTAAKQPSESVRYVFLQPLEMLVAAVK